MRIHSTRLPSQRATQACVASCSAVSPRSMTEELLGKPPLMDLPGRGDLTPSRRSLLAPLPLLALNAFISPPLALGLVDPAHVPVDRQRRRIEIAGLGEASMLLAMPLARRRDVRIGEPGRVTW